MTPAEAEGWFKVGVAVVSALAGVFSTWVLLRRDVADLKTHHSQMRTDLNGLGAKINGITTQEALDLQRMNTIESEIKDLRFLERGIPDRFTRERHDLVDRVINPLTLRLDGRISDLEDEVKELKRGRSA